MPSSLEEGNMIHFIDKHKRFVAKGYYGRQNKGYGWILSLKQNEKINTAFFARKIQSAFSYRKAFFADKATTAFRAFNGEGDGVGGLTIDYFDGFYVLTWYSEGIYSFKAMILEALKSQVKYKGIYQKKRFDSKGQYLDDEADFICGEKAPEPLIIQENKINFAIYLDDGPMVGIFLDQREVRKTLREKYAQNKNILNTFSYTGAFSVALAMGGSHKTTSVDLAKRSKNKTQEQFTINHLDLEKQEIIVEDVFHYFKYAVKKGKLFDIVVLDPPSFARNKKQTFSVAKDYVKLLKEAIQITQKGGVIIASTNYANLSLEKFKGFIDKAFTQLEGKYKLEQHFALPKDFRVADTFKEGNYLKVLFVRKL
jgi:23S rRNA (cytosine1962-C5)-methyltransferase